MTLDSIRNSCDVSTVTETADFIPNQEDMYIVCTDIFEIVFKLQLKLNHLSGINRSVSWSSSDLLSLQQQRRPWMQSKRPKSKIENILIFHELVEMSTPDASVCVGRLRRVRVVKEHHVAERLTVCPECINCTIWFPTTLP